MSAEACRNQASKFSLQAPHWPMRYDFGAADIRIGQTKSVHISWNPGRNFENQMGYLLEANELQPGLVPSHCYLPSTQKVTVCSKKLISLDIFLKPKRTSPSFFSSSWTGGNRHRCRWGSSESECRSGRWRATELVREIQISRTREIAATMIRCGCRQQNFVWRHCTLTAKGQRVHRSPWCDLCHRVVFCGIGY